VVPILAIRFEMKVCKRSLVSAGARDIEGYLIPAPLRRSDVTQIEDKYRVLRSLGVRIICVAIRKTSLSVDFVFVP
jgi:hypothetical protein